MLVAAVLAVLWTGAAARDCGFLASAFVRYANGSTGPIPSGFALGQQIGPFPRVTTTSAFCVRARFVLLLDQEKQIEAVVNHQPAGLPSVVALLSNETFAKQVDIECDHTGLKDANRTIVKNRYICCKTAVCQIPYFNGTEPGSIGATNGVSWLVGIVFICVNLFSILQ